MAATTSTAFVTVLRRHQLLAPAQLGEVEQKLAAQFPEPKALARELLQRGWLTAYQINQIGKNQAAELRLGNYVLLERLGEGGMGAVFKARHDKMGRVVALKVIRKERLDSPDAVQRFQREVHAAAQLNHPNIVQAHDADEAHGTHFLAMEYVEGTDLNRLVKDKGPLPPDQACEYILQAACGLAHAHEQGLVHRDIKPGNLMVDRKGVVKVLDMGIARLASAGEHTLTQEGAIVGSLDYIAPEQALQSHTVDSRADLYSLGCTFYFLLSGQVPFPGGEALEKLMKHQQQEPRPIEQLAPGVAPGVAAIVRRLMAKDPNERYPSAAALADALAQPTSGGRKHPDGTLDTGQRWAAIVDPEQTVTHAAAKPRPRRRLGLLLATAGVAVAGVLLAVWWSSGRPPQGTPATERTATAPPPAAPHLVKVQANQLWQDSGIDVLPGQTVTLVPDGYWRKDQTPISFRGQERAPRDRAVLPEAPLMCLLARIGSEAPVAVLKQQVLHAQQGGRLFVQANDLDLDLPPAKNTGSVKLSISGGVRAEERVPPAPLLPIQITEQEVRPLLVRAKDPAVKPEQLRDELIGFCLKHRGLPQVPQAAALFPRLPPLVNSIGMKLKAIPPGKFVMGSPPNEAGHREDEGPQHEVEITRPFFLGVHPVTVGQFREFVKATKYQTEAEKGGGAYRRFPDGTWANDPKASWLNPGFEQTDEHPVVCVSWHDAQAFCTWLNQQAGERALSSPRWKYTLPTEAQWEYSCRAGSSTRFHFGNNDAQLRDYDWYSDNSGMKAHPVGQKKPNAWGLFDMGGNVRNWCQDCYDKDYYQRSPRVDPTGPEKGSARVSRGGAGTTAADCRAAYRLAYAPSPRIAFLGFRLARVPSEE